MARMLADYGFDFTRINAHLLVSNQTDSQFYDNVYQSYLGRTYQDVARFDYVTAYSYRAFFGGSDVRFDSSGTKVIAGTATGYVVTVWGGSSFVPLWLVDGFSIAATKVASAIETSSTSDDFALLAAVLAGNDTIRLSPEADKMRGYTGNDKLFGNGGNDVLFGNEGDDTLVGGAGNDVLTGGAGRDLFVFSSAAIATNADSVRDFEKGVDKLALDDDVFSALGTGTATGRSINTAHFKVGATARDGNDYLVYDTATDKLYFDPDGSGPELARPVATIALAGSAAPAASDFLLLS